MNLNLKLSLAATLLVGLAACQSDTVTSLATHTTELDSVSRGLSHVSNTSAQTGFAPLPQRAGTPISTSGRVPHVQRNVLPNADVIRKLEQFAFSLPGVTQRPTIVSLPGAKGMWLQDTVPVTRPETIVAGREFAHIHTDGSLHAPLPYERALELTEKGWGERHPWADRRAGWEGFVMIFTPLDEAQLHTVRQLIIESYNYVTGQALSLSEL